MTVLYLDHLFLWLQLVYLQIVTDVAVYFFMCCTFLCGSIALGILFRKVSKEIPFIILLSSIVLEGLGIPYVGVLGLVTLTTLAWGQKFTGEFPGRKIVILSLIFSTSMIFTNQLFLGHSKYYLLPLLFTNSSFESVEYVGGGNYLPLDSNLTEKSSIPAYMIKATEGNHLAFDMPYIGNPIVTTFLPVTDLIVLFRAGIAILLGFLTYKLISVKSIWRVAVLSVIITFTASIIIV